ncbi:hypothetical protein L914_00531 [Phytophthora nicotianae]|uniref:Uncharacterized protein n=1 Tax=Phytophthora nicotianae TaxID=4792 RepID=W2P957_PHYNI|nr:hypothetical protein L914_00531 [Phytophthora nicotianae]
MSVTDPSDSYMDETIVLDTFTVSGEEDEGKLFGVIVSSRRVFRNIANSVRDQGNELVCATDGTYKLHFGGWTVVDCGSVTWSRGKAVHRFIPWVYMFVRSESTAAYARMFQNRSRKKSWHSSTLKSMLHLAVSTTATLLHLLFSQPDRLLHW